VNRSSSIVSVRAVSPQHSINLFPVLTRGQPPNVREVPGAGPGPMQSRAPAAYRPGTLLCRRRGTWAHGRCHSRQRQPVPLPPLPSSGHRIVFVQAASARRVVEGIRSLERVLGDGFPVVPNRQIPEGHRIDVVAQRAHAAVAQDELADSRVPTADPKFVDVSNHSEVPDHVPGLRTHTPMKRPPFGLISHLASSMPCALILAVTTPV